MQDGSTLSVLNTLTRGVLTERCIGRGGQRPGEDEGGDYARRAAEEGLGCVVADGDAAAARAQPRIF